MSGLRARLDRDSYLPGKGRPWRLVPISMGWVVFYRGAAVAQSDNLQYAMKRIEAIERAK